MNQSWRRKSTGDGSPQSSRYWQEHKKRDASADAANLRRLKLGVLTLLLFGSIGGFVWYFLFVPSRLVIFPITIHYQSPLPVNGLATEDVLQLRETLLENFVIADTLASRHDNVPDRDAFMRQFIGRLDKLKPLGPTIFQKTFVVYLSAHGVVNERDEPCFLMAGSDPHNSTTWLPASELIDALQTHPNLRSADIVLMLDANRVQDAWEIGVVENNFADRIFSLVTKSASDRLYVINSSSPGQHAYNAPEIGGTIFGHYVALGLAGATGGTTVSLTELVQYLEVNVSEFARQFRHEQQRPCLIKGEKADGNFKLAYCLDTPKIKSPDGNALTERLRSRNDDVKELWNKFERCHNEEAFRFQPMAYAEAGANLVRLEQLIIAGSDYNRQYSDTLGRTSKQIDNLLNARDAFTDVATTAAALSQFKAYRNLLATPAFAEWREAQADPAKEATPPSDGRQACALAIWNWLTGLEEVRADDLAIAEQYLALSETDAVFLPSEVHYIRLLSKYLPWGSRKDWKKILPRALSIHRKTRELAAPDDIRSFYWVQDALDKMESRLRTARDKVFVGSDDAIDDANRTWNAIDPVPDSSIVVQDVTSNDSQFSRIRSQQMAVSNAYRQRDASFALTPLFARWAAHSKRKIGREPIDELVKATNSLAVELDNGSLDAALPYAEQIKELLASLQKAFEEECKECVDSGDRAVYEEVLRDASRLILYPIPTPGKKYHNRLREKLLVHRWTKSRDITLDTATGERFADTANTARNSVAEHPAAAIFPSRDTLENLSTLGGAIRKHMKSVRVEAESLEAATRKQVGRPEAPFAKPMAARRPLSQADRMCRWVATFAPNESLDFVNDLWRYDHHFFLIWQAERSLLDLWGPEPDDESQDAFFIKAVGSCLAAAKTLYPAATPYRDTIAAMTESADASIASWEPVKCDDLRLFDDVANAGLVPHSLRFEPLVETSNPLSEQLELSTSTPALFIRSWNKPFPWFDPESRLTKVPLGRREPTEQRMRHAFDGAELKKEPSLWAVTLFRGHEKLTPLRADKGQGTVFNRPRPKQTTVTVLGNQGPRTEIMFVLDCSGSMGHKQMNSAKRMLNRVTQMLIKNGGNCDVGLYIFGHRFVGEAIPNETDVGKRARVRYLVQMGPSNLTVPEIQRELEKVKAEGFTPLYESILQSAGAFGGATKKQMIVITDGENGVLNQTPEQADRIAANANAAIQRNGALVEIIGLGVTNGTFQKGPRIEAFAGLSPRINYSNNPNIKDVEAKILKALGLSTYAVTPTGGKTYTMSMGDRWLSPVLSPGNCIVSVSNAASEEIILEGGEALEIESGRQLTHRPYRRNDRSIDVGDISQRVRFHTNVHTGSRFSVSIQNLDASFTRRPKRAMLSIRPDNNKDQEFIAHEAEFEPRRPVPVLHYRLTGWPRATKALLQLSYLNDDPIGVRRVSLDLTNGQLTQPFKRDVRFELDVTPSRDGGPIRVNVNEVHASESKHFPLHLSFHPAPLTARHSVAEKSQDGTREVLHEFTIERDRVTNVNVNLQVTTPEERRVNWINLDPVSIDVDHWSR